MADEIYNYGGIIEIPEKSLDKIAHITLSRFNESVRYQSMEMIGGMSLREAMRNCYDQYNGILSPRDREIADAIGVDAYVNLTARKCGIVHSFLMESLVTANTLPWTVEPTPIPDLAAADETAALSELEQEILNGYSGDLRALASEIKTAYVGKAFERAKIIAANMEKLITDQCMEGGWNRAMPAFLSDFTVYPFAVLQGPVPVRRTRLSWSGESVRPKSEIYYEFNSVSPWDFWYTPDSPDTQRGTGVFIRQRWTRRQLLDAISIPSYLPKNIKKVLEDAVRDNFIFRWLSENPEQPSNWRSTWHDCSATVDVLIHYGIFSGSELRDYGVKVDDDHEFYNATVTVCGKHTIQVAVNPNPSVHARPVFTASFYKTQDRIPAFSIPQRIRDAERCYQIALRHLISNAAQASAPITEVNYSRIAKYMNDEDIGSIVPGTVYLSDSEIGDASPAFKFYSVPSVMPQYMQIMSYFMNLVDEVSNIPAALHGTAQGSGANRTFRGAAMLQGNAVKAIQAAVSNIDQTVFGPMGELLYNYNMVYSKDPAVKGDCKVLARGSSGLLQREIDRQNSFEILQMVSSAGQQLAALPQGQKIITWALSNVLRQMDVPEELLRGVADTPPAPTGLDATGNPEAQMGAPAAAPAESTVQTNAVEGVGIS